MTDVGAYPFRQAAHYTKGRTKPIRLIVIHDMESGETDKTAENVAAMFADPNSRAASAHFCVDSDSIVRCVHDADTAWQAAGANHDGIGIEHAGRANQTAEQWLDPFGKAMLERSAVLTAQLCKAYGIPAVHLSVAQVADGRSKGLCGHGDVSRAFPAVSTGHTDPGPNFPWAYYLSRVKAHLAPPRPLLHFGSKGPDVLRFTVALNKHGYPTSDRDVYGNPTFRQVKRLQADHHLTVTGTATVPTWQALGL